MQKPCSAGGVKMNIVEKRRSILINLTFYSLIIGAYYLFMKYALWLVAPFVFAFFIAMFLQKPIRAVSKKTKIKKSILAAIAIILIIAVLASVLAVVGHRLFTEFKDFGQYIIAKLQDLPNVIRASENWILGHIRFLPDSFEATIAESVSDFADRLLLLVVEQKNTFTQPDASAGGFDLSIFSAPIGGLISTAKQIPAFLTAVLISIIACFFLTCDYDNFTGIIKNAISEEHEEKLVRTKHLFGDILSKMIKSYATIILITFCEVAIGLNILKLIGVYDGGYIIAISIVTAFVDIFPVLGTGTVMMPWAIISLVSGRYGLGIGLLVLYAAVTVIRQVLEPKLVSMNVGIHPIFTLMGMYLGVQLFGVLGIFILPITFFLVNALNEEGIIHLWGRKKAE